MSVVQTLGRFATDCVWDPAGGTPMVLQETNREDFIRYSSDPNDTAVYRTRSEYTYVYGLGLISITDGLGNQRYALPDALGSVRTVVNGADGGVYTGYSYDAFGVPNELGGLQTTFRFAGEQYDYKARKQAGVFGLGGTPGLQYLRARFYDPTLGRFLTRDPLAGSARDPQSLNAYPYVQNNPVNRVDPSGMLTEGVGENGLLLTTNLPVILHCLELTIEALGPLAFAIIALGGLFALGVAATNPATAAPYLVTGGLLLSLAYLICLEASSE